MNRNKNFSLISNRYLFHEIKKRRANFIEKNPHADILSLGIGDTTEPLVESIVQGIKQTTDNLATFSGYKGYGPEQGYDDIRSAISDVIYKNQVSKDDIFVSDGIKCDIGRIQLLFDDTTQFILPDPCYPVYADTTILSHGTKNIRFLPCTIANNFIPDIFSIDTADVIFLCSPNNPTGTTLSREFLEDVVQYALEKQSLILFDAAYMSFIQDTKTVRSIYEIPNAKRCAIEFGSFSKMAGFSGIRLSWSVVPEELQYANHTSIKNDWMRIMTTYFNGASYISQQAARYALTNVGQVQIQKQINHYLNNTHLLKKALHTCGITFFGGENCPYIWAYFPDMTSWDIFDMFLEKASIIVTPGSGFGPSGEHFVRISAFGTEGTIQKAYHRIIESFENLYKSHPIQ